MRRISPVWLSLLLAPALLAGCGSGSGPSPTPALSGNTQVTVLLASKSNGALAKYYMAISTITLTNQAGKLVPLVDMTATGTPYLPYQIAEYIHLDGSSEALATVTVPQDIYTAATVTSNFGSFTCASQTGAGLQTSTYEDNGPGLIKATVSLASPITVTGAAMGLAFTMDLPHSATYPSCDASGVTSAFALNPSFALTPVNFAKANAGFSPVQANVAGLVATVVPPGTSFTVNGFDGISFTAATNASTTWQGIGGAAALAPGMPVYFDAAIQADGSLLATRVAVPDTNTSNLSATAGPLIFVSNFQPTGFFVPLQTQGTLFATYGVLGSQAFSFGNASFGIAGPTANLSSLPFVPVFNASTMVAGQNISVTSHATSYQNGPIYMAGSVVSLVPQTIDGTVQSIATSGNFTVYTIGLAAYNLFPNLAVQAGQTTLLKSANTVVLYADTSTRQTTTSTIAQGGTLRATGLIFNDGGTLRMVCSQLSDGVAP